MTVPTARAELVEDRGAAAAGEDFFRSPAFFDAEGVTHTLRIVAGEVELLGPLIVRPIGEGPERDAISPYGYPGLTPTAGGSQMRRPGYKMSTTRLEAGEIDLSPTGLVSAFIRHALGEPPLSDTTERNTVQIADPALPPKSRPSDRRQIRRNLEAGYELELCPGPETTPGQRADFCDLYDQTMRRTAAASHYRFGAAYFDRLLESPLTWLAIARAPGGDPAAASLAARSDGFLHYHLSGSADAHLRDSPMKNVVARLIELAGDLSLPLNLGGGLAPGDALEEFKRGFANRQLPFRTSELICDPEKYTALSSNKPPSSFFPTYRS